MGGHREGILTVHEIGSGLNFRVKCLGGVRVEFVSGVRVRVKVFRIPSESMRPFIDLDTSGD